MKRFRHIILLLFLTIGIVFFCFPLYGYTENNTLYNKIEYSISKDGILTVYGNGVVEWKNFDEEDFSDGLGSGIKKIIVKEGITEIGIDCFSNFDDLEYVSLPDSLSSIKKSAFEECINLKEIKLPSGISTISRNTFYNCKSLTSIVIPSSVKTIEKGAFYGCKYLKKLVLPKSLLTWINPIQKCPSLKKIVNRSYLDLNLDDCKGYKKWYVNGKKVTTVFAQKTAVAKGKKYIIKYNLLGGRASKKLPSVYRYGSNKKLSMYVKKKGYYLIGWTNPDDEEQGPYVYHVGPSLHKNIVLKPVWIKYKIRNLKGRKAQILIDDTGCVISSYAFKLRYSKYKDMSDAKYVSGISRDSNKVTLKNLRKGKRYYFEIAYLDDAIEGPYQWVGKRNVVITK